MVYHELEQDTLTFVERVWKQYYNSTYIQVKFIGNKKLKPLVKLTKASPLYEYNYGVQLYVEINESLFQKIQDDKCVEILLHQEFSRIEFDSENDKLKVVKNNFESNVDTVKKFGVEDVYRANLIVKEAVSQAEDQEQEQG